MLKYLLLALLMLLLAVFLVRGWQAMNGPPLQLWHIFVPDEPAPAEIDAMDWAHWLKRENAIFASVKSNVTDKLPPEQRIAQNRYWQGAPIYPPALARDWNRSFTLEPDGPTRGAVLLLHGLTDSPYSLRHVGELYQARGFRVVAVRLPGHGTVPAGLTKASVEQWQAATRMAARETRRRAPDGPLHIVGYSNGAALAVDYALDAAANPQLPAPDRIVLISPMIGLTPFARFTGMAGWPALFPAFVKAAWLDIIPEYNPFKYNSFSVRAGVEAHRLAQLLGDKLTRAASDGRFDRLPPILAFQSVVDSTVSAPAVVSGLFDHLPANGSELVLFDVNRAAYVGPLIRASALNALEPLLPRGPRKYRTTVIGNSGPGHPETLVRSFAPGETGATETPLALPYPRDVFSLGHVSLPFPPTDGLYGIDPDPMDDQGISLGALAFRGENGVLSVNPASLVRVSSNPFFPWMLGRIDAALVPKSAEATATGTKAR